MEEAKETANTQGARPMRPFFLLWTGQALSLLASQAVQFALIWWLTAESGSATVLATATFLGVLPPIAIGPFAGALVDRWNRRRMMLAADGVVAIASAALAVMFFLDTASVAAVFAGLLVRAIGATFHGPAMLASTSLMVPEQHLARIQGINQMLAGGMLVVAAPLGGLLLALFTMGGIMLLDVATALFAILPLLFIAVPQPGRGPDHELTGGVVRRMFHDIGEGLHYLRAGPGLVAIALIAMSVNLLMLPAFSLLPLLISKDLGGGAPELAGTNSAFGVGTLAGGILLGIWGGFRRRIVTTLVGLIGLGGASLAVGLAPSILAVAMAMLFVGAFVTLANGPIQAILQATVAPDYQGRIFTLIGSLAGITAPVGLLLAAPVAEIVGVRAWYVAGALVCVLMGTTGFMVPSVLRIEDGPQPRLGTPHPSSNPPK